jgi:hypothetical protein
MLSEVLIYYLSYSLTPSTPSKILLIDFCTYCFQKILNRGKNIFVKNLVHRDQLKISHIIITI